MASIPLPIGSYVTNDSEVSCKRLVNCFSEPVPADSVLQELKGGNPYQESAPSILRRWAGITSFTNPAPGQPVRGLWMMQGTLYAVVGQSLYSITPSGTATQVGTGIAGTSFVRMTDNTQCLVILVPNTALCYTYCPNTISTLVTFSSVQIADTIGDFTCSATTLTVGMQVTVSGTFSGSGSIAGYSNPTIYQISETNGSTSFTLTTLGGSNLTTVAGTTTGATFTTGTLAGPPFSQITVTPVVTLGAIDIHFLDGYIVFLAMNGKEFYNDDGNFISGPNQISFNTNAIFPREFGTDKYVGMGVDHREITLFGTWTSEGYVNVGNPIGSPFSTAPQSFMEIGCHPLAAYSVALQDQTLFWVASDLTIRRKNGQTPQRVSNSGIEAILEHANLTGCYALTPSIAGHSLWILVIPAAFRTIVYDCLTGEWFELESFGLGYWRALSYINTYGRQFVGDSAGNGVGFLDTNSSQEFGIQQICSFTTQPVYKDHNRIVHRRLEIICTTGEGGFSGSELSLYVSDDSANTFRGFPLRNLGPTGAFFTRAIWFNLGQSRSRVYKFTTSDPTQLFTVQITTELELCKW
jgi:hypothetical protein